jgi:hypothetical protein
LARDSNRLPVRLQEGLLDDVLGILGIAGHPVRKPIHGTAMTVDERPEGLAVTVPRQRDGSGVRLRHPSD